MTGPGFLRPDIHLLRAIASMTLQDVLHASKLRGVASKQPIYYPSGTLWPHGEFSLGYAPSLVEGGDWHENPLGVSEAALDRLCDGSGAAFAVDEYLDSLEASACSGGGEAGGQPLNLSDASNSHSRRKARGSSGITGYGRNMVKAAGHLMAELYPRHRTTFCTVTLPPMTREQRSLVSAGWSEVVRQVLQTVCRRLAAVGAPQLVVSVSEVQPKRLRETGEAYLHLHLIWLNLPARCGKWSVAPADIRRVVASVLSKLIGGYPVGHVNVNVRPVKGSVAAYMSKYMSKGSDVLVEALEDWGEDNGPSTWWNMSKCARDMVGEYTCSGPEIGGSLDRLMSIYWAAGGTDDIAYLRAIELEFDGRAVVVGYRGRFEPGANKRIRSVLGLRDIASLE